MTPALALPSRESWLAERRTGLGSSDAAAVLGKGFKSPMELWSEKCGLVEPPDLSNDPKVNAGILFEPVVAEWYAKETGRVLVDHGRYALRRSPAHSFMHATVDREIVGDERGSACLEIKTTSERLARAWSEDPPDHVLIQVAHQMAVLDLAWASIAVLIGGQKLEWFDLERNERFIKLLVANEAAFWTLVESGTPPETDGSDSCRAALAALYPKDNGKIISLPASFGAVTSRCLLLKEEIALRESALGECQNALRAALADNTEGVLPDGAAWTLKTVERREHVVKASSSRVLRYRAPK